MPLLMEQLYLIGFFNFYFVLWPVNAQLFHKLSHSHMFPHYGVILRELVISTFPSYTSISYAHIGKTIYNEDNVTAIRTLKLLTYSLHGAESFLSS